MDFMSIFYELASDTMESERAVFDRSMENHFKENKMTMADVIFNVFQCQKCIGIMGNQIDSLEELVSDLSDKLAAKTAPKKKVK